MVQGALRKCKACNLGLMMPPASGNSVAVVHYDLFGKDMCSVQLNHRHRYHHVNLCYL